MVAGVLVDAEDRRRGVAVALVSTVVFIVGALALGDGRTWTTPTAPDWITVGLAFVGTLVLLPAAVPTSETDRRSGIVERRRVSAARLVAVIVILAAIALSGGAGVAAVGATVVAAVLGTAARRVSSPGR